MREITDLSELQGLELAIMKKIHAFCEENGIRYYLCFGTLIGAIRHGGFIPWDDDIDIFMPRPDYEKFLALFPQKMQEYGLGLANHLTKPYFGRCITKIYDTNTVLYEPQYKTDDPIGVFVDIWPLDGFPGTKSKMKRVARRAVFLKKLILASSSRLRKENGWKKNLLILLAKPFNPKKLVKKLDALAKSYPYETSPYIKAYSGIHVLYTREEWEKRILVPFEDTQLYVPENYDELLRRVYGDYMKLPPEEKQQPHHIICTFYKDGADEK